MVATLAGVGQYRDASIVSARPVVPGPVVEYAPPSALTAGSQINKAAIGGPTITQKLTSGSSLDKAQIGAPWPGIVNGLVKFFNSWRPNAFREVANHNVAGNYGAESSKANFGFLGREFPDGLAGMAMDNAGGNHGTPFRPEWNNLVPIIWALRVANQAPAGSVNDGSQQIGMAPQSVVSQYVTPAEFTPTGVASLAMKGVVLQ
jgi:hypothetical protein